MMNPFSKPEQPTSAVIDHAPLDLPEALLCHVEAGRLNPERAKVLSEELEERALIISAHRNTARQANAGFFSINPHERFVDPNHAVFSATKDQIAHDLATFAEAVAARFAMSDHDYITKTDIAFDFGHTDQAGDWAAPAELDELITYATDEAFLRQELNDEHIEVVPHSREHEKISYKFWAINPGAATSVIIRQRPYADIIFTVNDEPVCVQIFRKSWFLINADETNPDIQRLVDGAIPGKDMTEEANIVLSQYLDAILADADKDQQTIVFPCTMTYVARVIDDERLARKEARRQELKQLDRNQGR